MKRFHKKIEYNCVICGLSFSSMNHKNRHLRNVHKDFDPSSNVTQGGEATFLQDKEGNIQNSASNCIVQKEVTRPKTFPCERPNCKSFFDEFSSLSRHLSKVKECKEFYGPDRLETMRKELKNIRQKERRAAQSETERKLILEKIRMKRSLHSDEIRAKQRLNYAKKKARMSQIEMNTIYFDETSEENTAIYSGHVVD